LRLGILYIFLGYYGIFHNSLAIETWHPSYVTWLPGVFHTYMAIDTWHLEFFGPQMALAHRLDAISQGPKNSPFPGPNPLPLAHVFICPYQKQYDRGRINHWCINSSFLFMLFNITSSAASQIPLWLRMLRSSLGLLRLWHWQPDAL
jgi:hypothetical protein